MCVSCGRSVEACRTAFRSRGASRSPPFRRGARARTASTAALRGAERRDYSAGATPESGAGPWLPRSSCRRSSPCRLRLRYRAHDRQSEPRPAARPLAVAACEPLECVRRDSAGTPSPSSLTSISARSARPASRDPDLAAPMAERVVDQVSERLPRPQRDLPRRSRRPAASTRISRPCPRARSAKRWPVRSSSSRDRRAARASAAGGHRRRGRSAAGPRRAVRGDPSPRARPPSDLRTSASSSADPNGGLQLGFQDGERRAELVAGVGHEPALALKRLLAAGRASR